MLIANGQSYWFVALIVVLAIAAFIALITREKSLAESAKPFSLSDEERLLLQTIALESRRQGRQESKKSRKAAIRAAKAGEITANQDDE